MYSGRLFAHFFFIVQIGAVPHVKRLKPQYGSLAGGTMLIIEGEGKLLFLDYKENEKEILILKYIFIGIVVVLCCVYTATQIQNYLLFQFRAVKLQRTHKTTQKPISAITFQRQKI